MPARASSQARSRSIVAAVLFLAACAAAGAGIALYYLQPASAADAAALARAPGPVVSLGEDLVVNLTDRQQPRFVRAGIALQLAEASSGRVEPVQGRGGREHLDAEAEVREIAIAALARESSRSLGTAAGRAAVKKRIIRRVRAQTDIRVLAVFYTSFAVA